MYERCCSSLGTGVKLTQNAVCLHNHVLAGVAIGKFAFGDPQPLESPSVAAPHPQRTLQPALGCLDTTAFFRQSSFAVAEFDPRPSLRSELGTAAHVGELGVLELGRCLQSRLDVGAFLWAFLNKPDPKNTHSRRVTPNSFC